MYTYSDEGRLDLWNPQEGLRWFEVEYKKYKDGLSASYIANAYLELIAHYRDESYSILLDKLISDEDICAFFQKSERTFQQLVSWASLAYENKMPEAMVYVSEGYIKSLTVAENLSPYFDHYFSKNKIEKNSGPCVEHYDILGENFKKVFYEKIHSELEELYQRNPMLA